MNGIIEYDQKLTSLPTFLLIRHISPKIIYWNISFIIVLIYYVAITSVLLYLWPPKTIDVFIAVFFIRLEFIVNVSIMFFTYFFLQQLEYRFQVLNNAWIHLLPRFLSNSGDSTHFIIGMTLDKIRLLHAELSDLLIIFSDGFGKMLLGYYIFCYYDMILSFTCNFFLFDQPDIIAQILPYIFSVQNIIFILSILIAASNVHEKKRKMISNLRLIRISNLSANLKVKLFMNQIIVLESSEITAFGIFSINLNFVVSILVLLITGLTTMMQMKEHPIMLEVRQNFKHFLKNVTDVK
ncbi:uncharacterized protein LOC126549553 isoform X2 [Aphis gossypii]|uniref:uncharacterized protein LOC126549553 isoform X2 n=1 Tax=Aphis gossypii TaxID=80765 RepID=UPI00215964EA|nr:uncharacterized protein LOC126549553 isoform X2 [Aphis gossypii]